MGPVRVLWLKITSAFGSVNGRPLYGFKTRLKKQGVAFQGMAYREASDQISNWIEKNNPEKGSVYYVGFNAMNPVKRIS